MGIPQWPSPTYTFQMHRHQQIRHIFPRTSQGAMNSGVPTKTINSLLPTVIERNYHQTLYKNNVFSLVKNKADDKMDIHMA